jgi:hypothetical protein
MAALDRRRTELAGDPERQARRGVARREEFLTLLGDALMARLEHGLREGALQTVAAGLDSGALDPYGAALELLGDERSLAALLAPR